MKTTKTLLAFGACLLVAGQTWGVEYWLRAAPTTITLPDGTQAGRTVTVWGFAMDSSETTEDGTVTVPGPTIIVPGDVGTGANVVPGDLNLTIHLKNYLPEPVSIVIPGQLGAALGDPAKFIPTGDTRERARSLTHEAPASDGTTPTTATYSWNNIQPGTYIYHSGSHMAVQVKMGLYGAMTKIHANLGPVANPTYQAYQGVDYKQDLTLLFSEVDVELNDAVAGGQFGRDDVDNEPLGWSTPGGTMSPGDVDVNGNGLFDSVTDTDNPPSGWSTGGPMSPPDLDYNGNGTFDTYAMHSVSQSEPDYFLINGKPYTTGQVPTSLNTLDQAALLRFINVGHDTHLPILNGLHLELVAENGKPYLDRKNVYSVNLPSLQTVDARLAAAPLGVHALYDRRLGLSDAANTSGGMLTYLAIGQSQQRRNAITIPNGPGNASTYPAPINYTWPAGTAGTIGKVTVTIQGFYHARPQDVDMLLVSPALAGQPAKSVLLMSDTGGGTANAIPNTTAGRVTLTFDDAASAPLTTSQLVTGTYKSTNLDANAGDAGADTFPTSPQPSGPYSTSLSDFNGLNPNGQWRLYIRDDQGGAGTGGGLANGWSITIAPKQ